MRVLLGLVAISVFGMVALWLTTTAASTPSRDDQMVDQAIMSGLHTERTAWLPPVALRGRLLTSDEAATVKKSLVDKLNKSYTGDALAHWTGMLETAIDNQTSDGGPQKPYSVVALDGGINSIQILSEQVSGDLATARVQADIWSKVAQVQPDGKLVAATPHNTVIYDLTLIRVDGTWKISQESWTFAPGSQP